MAEEVEEAQIALGGREARLGRAREPRGRRLVVGAAVACAPMVKHAELLLRRGVAALGRRHHRREDLLHGPVLLPETRLAIHDALDLHHPRCRSGALALANLPAPNEPRGVRETPPRAATSLR